MGSVAAEISPDSRVEDTPVGRVLVVDDDHLFRAMCATTLQFAGLDVIEAHDGPTGLERAISEAPDLVLLDVRMPGLDGFEVAAAIRDHAPTRKLPIIFLTAEGTPSDHERASALQAIDYITKPFDPVDLAARVMTSLPTARLN